MGDIENITKKSCERIISESNNLFIHRKGDEYDYHTCGDRHKAYGKTASESVFVENLGCRRIDDIVSCGGKAKTGSPDVFAG